MVREVRDRIRAWPAPPCSPTRRQVVSGRGVRQVGAARKYLWRAVDQKGNVLDVLVQSRRNAEAVKRFLGKLMCKQAGTPRVLMTDKLASYVVAHRELTPSVEHRRSKYLNNRDENSHQPTRQRERAMKFFRSPGAAHPGDVQRDPPHFRPGRHKLTASDYRSEMTDRFATRNDVTGVTIAA